MQENNLEARTWLKNNKNTSALGTNRFGTTEKALEFVEKLYELGAELVEIDGVMDEPSRIEEEGGPYADSLIVTLPDDEDKRKAVFEVYKKETIDQGFEAEEYNGESEVTFWWD